MSVTAIYNITIVALILLSVTYFLHALYCLFFHPLRKYPGPWHWAISDLPRIAYAIQGTYVQYSHELHLKYGDIVRVGPNELSYIDGQAWKDIYNRHRGTFLKDPDFFGEAPNSVVHVASASGATHARMRRMLLRGFSERAIREQGDLLLRHIDHLMSAIRNLIAKNGSAVPFNLVDMFNFTAFDLQADMTFGESLHLLDNQTYVPWVRASMTGVKFMAIRCVLRKLALIGRVVELLTASRKKLVEHFNFSADMVDRRLARPDSTNPDIWRFVLQEKEEVRLTLPEMHANAFALMMAGSETTATVLSGLVYFLLQTPEAMKRLAAEIRDAFATDADITPRTVARLEYLDGCIMESMRLYPAAAVGLPRLVPAGGVNICNDMIPGGTMVYVSNYAANRSPHNFSRPEEYLPERWLGLDAAFEGDHKDAFQPFSVGPQNCLGQNLAWPEMRLIMSKLLWNFDIKGTKANEGWTDQKTYIVWEKKPLMVHMSLRST
ncbi:benzoate 4-monooxygenase cytochrome P450 [Aspergillus sclerotiicarbonarius CBS 121057]|uniref:Benzoate 4-monooxygenase cytochrome P450 n=1 Tax=Aspergillus sclerotiicarbonarius (strain CBS 121057 / IBT 28362) TaxID=1448318 RepID=A0A319EHJ7_ASPSB|nr:benzoate 4-monooxygenase cytochrome P450 [Aspergillus sclerotiicarbonarius CBS 121057]